MTQYSRTVIPGRTRSSSDLEPNTFGLRNIEAEQPPPEPIVRARGEPRGGRDADDAFSPLPGEARHAHGDHDNLRGNVLLYGALGVFVVFAAVVWNAYSSGLRDPEDEAAPLLAAAGPFKSEPVPLAEDPIARDAASQAEVFERFDGEPAARPIEPELSGGGEAPATRASSALPDAPAYVAGVVPPIRPSASEATAARPEAPTVSAPRAEAPRINAVAGATPAADPAAGSVVSLVPRSPPPAAAEPVAPKVVAPSVAPPSASKGLFIQGGPYVVQLAAPGSESAAEAEWTRRKAAAGDLFEGAEKLIVPASVNGKSVYRVRVGSFGTAAEADAFCSALKTRGGDCFRANR